MKKEASMTGRHAAPPPPPPVIEKKEKTPKELRSDRRKRSVLGGLGLVVAILLILGFALRGAAEERRYDTHLTAAKDCYAAGDYENALVHLRQAADREETPDMRLMMADCYEAVGNYDKALELLRSMDLSDTAVHARIDRLENAKELLRQARKIHIAGMEFDREASSLIIRRTDLSAEDLQNVAELYALNSLSLTEDGLEDVSVLTALGGLTMLDLSGNEITDLSPLASLSGLRTLYLDSNPITDFSPLYGLPELATLSIHEIEISEAQLAELSQALPNCAIKSETAVAEVHELTIGGVTFREDVTELDLSGLELSDVSALSGCRQLKKLNLSNNRIADLTALMDLPYLEELYLADNQISDLRPLMAMKSLRIIDAARNLITTTAPLSYLTELTQLDLSGNALSDLNGLRTLEKLETLSLENAQLKNDYLEALSGLASLKVLNIKENPELTGEEVEELGRSLASCYMETSRLVYTTEINGKRYRQDLTELDLSGVGEPFDLSNLAMIPTLEVLNLSGNKLEYIYDLKPMDKLRELNLSNNQISDTTPLAYLNELEKLDLSNNSVNSVTALLNLTQLKELDIRGNKLTTEQIEKLERTLPDCKILHD